MVNQAEQPDNTQSAPPTDGGGTTTDITSEFEGVNTFNDTDTSPTDITTTEETTETVGEVTTPPPSTEPPTESPAVTEPVASTEEVPGNNEEIDTLQKRLEAIEQQNNQYQQNQVRGQLQQQANQYSQQLEQQGYLPDQAQQVAQQWMAQQSEVVRVRQEQEQYNKFVQGQNNAAEHFATKYKLELNDLAELRRYDTPEGMEQAAKGMASIRDKDSEIARLRAQLVPSQNFADNQSTPAASNNEDRWLERYNDGDRSPEAAAAARRAAGLG